MIAWIIGITAHCVSRQGIHIVRFPVADAGGEYAYRMSAEEHDQVRSELRLHWSASLHAGSSWTGGWVRASDPGRHRQLLGWSAGRQVQGRDVRLRVQFRRVLEICVADIRLELINTGHVGRTSVYLVHVCTATLLLCRFRCLCIIDQWDDAVLGAWLASTTWRTR